MPIRALPFHTDVYFPGRQTWMRGLERLREKKGGERVEGGRERGKEREKTFRRANIFKVTW